MHATRTAVPSTPNGVTHTHTHSDASPSGRGWPAITTSASVVVLVDAPRDVKILTAIAVGFEPTRSATDSPPERT